MPAATFYTSFSSPIGIIRISATERGVRSVMFVDSVEEESSGAPAFLLECREQLEEYFAGERKTFHEVPLAYAGTEFQNRVWDCAAAIPFGTTMTYGELAKEVGSPEAARAVGTALGRNALAIIVPCHRIVAGDEDGGGYAWGMERKVWLLKHERAR